MLKSCKYCGRVHDSRQICPQKQGATARKHSKKKGTDVDKFHASNRWKEKSLYIRERDHYMCLACFFNLDGKGRRITSGGLSVHHIVPIVESWEQRTNDENLITLCFEHHKQAEEGELDRKKLLEAVKIAAEGRLFSTRPPF